jgi:hypothetical protein
MQPKLVLGCPTIENLLEPLVHEYPLFKYNLTYLRFLHEHLMKIPWLKITSWLVMSILGRTKPPLSMF